LSQAAGCKGKVGWGRGGPTPALKPGLRVGIAKKKSSLGRRRIVGVIKDSTSGDEKGKVRRRTLSAEVKDSVRHSWNVVGPAPEIERGANHREVVTDLNGPERGGGTGKEARCAGGGESAKIRQNIIATR